MSVLINPSIFGAPPSLTVANASVADNAAAATVITPIIAPSGYTTVLNYDCGGRYAISGGNLVTTAVPLIPGVDRPIIGAYKAGVLGSLRPYPAFEQHPDITVTATRVPNDFANLLGAWRAEDAVLSGSDITSIPGWSLTGALTGTGATTNKPQFVASIGPNNKGLIHTVAAADRRRFTLPSTFAPTDFTIAITISPEYSGSVQNILSDAAGTNNFIAFAAGAGNLIAAMSLRTTGMAAAVTLTFPATGGKMDTSATTKGLVPLIIAFNGTTKVATAYIGARTLTANATLTNSTSVSWTDFLGRSGGNCMTNADVGMFAAWSRNITDATEIDQLFALLAPYSSRDHYFAANGDDANRGWNPTYPKLLPATFIAAHYNYPGQRWWLKGGDRFSWSTALSPLNDTSTALLQSSIRGYNGYALVTPATKKAAGSAAWTETSPGSHLWTTSWLTAAPTLAWLKLGTTETYTGLDEYQLIQSRATSSTWSFTWSADVMTARFDDVIDPNNYDVEIAPNATTPISTDRDYFGLADIDQKFCGNIASQLTGDAAFRHRVRGSYCGGDILNWNNPGAAFELDCVAMGQGVDGDIFSDVDTDSDGTTSHTTGVIESWRCWYVKSQSAGLSDQEFVTRTQYDCQYILNNKAGVRLASGTGSGAKTWLVRRVLVVRPAVTTGGGFTFDDGFRILSGADLVTLDIDDAYFDGSLGSVRGKALNAIAGTLVVGSNVAQTGFSSLQ